MPRTNRSRYTTSRLLNSSGRPVLEHMEERRLLATFVVDSLGTTDDGDYSPGNLTLIEAVNLANASGTADEIIISDTLAGQTLNLPAELTITGITTLRGPTTGTFTISGQNTTRLFVIDNGNAGTSIPVVFENLILTNANATNGGAIVSHENLELRGVRILNSVATDSVGGAINVLNGSLNINADSRLIGNQANTLGGAIHLAANTTLTISNSTLSSNTAGTEGGAIYAVNLNTLTITNTTFTGNSTTANDGGAINMFNGASLNISNSSFTNNSAQSDGGALWASLTNNAPLNLNTVTFENNSAGSSAGAIDLNLNSAGTASFSDLTFTNNSAGTNAGAIRVLGDGQVLTISNSTFTSNSASAEGGAIEAIADKFSITGSTFTSNSATLGGAIASIHAIGRTINIENSTFTSNSASSNGGAIYSRKIADTVTADPTVRIIGSTISNNTAGTGAGIYVTADKNTLIHIETTLIADNTANGSGGGIALTGINDEITFRANILQSTIRGNRASGFDGGGIFSTAGEMIITNSVIRENIAQRDGGGIFESGTATTLLRSTVASNTAGQRGAGMFKSRVNTNIALTESLFSNNTTTNGDGGALFFNNGNSITVLGSTISGNTGTSGGGLRLSQITTATINNSTITNNTARTTFGGVSFANTALSVRSSIIAGNFDADNVNVNINAADLTTNSNNLLSGSPGLTILADWGGPTLTHMPTQGSPAINAGANPNALSTDARGFPRDDGNGVDIGATEAFRPVVTFDAQAITINNGIVVLNVASATDQDGTVESISVYLDANNDGIPDPSELVDTIGVGGTVSFPVESLAVGANNLLLVPVDNTGLLGAPTTATATLVAVPGFNSVVLRDAAGQTFTAIDRDRAFTVNVTSPTVSNAAGVIQNVQVFVDRNGNGIPDAGELLGEGVFTPGAEAGTGTVTITRELSVTLPLGAVNLLVVPLTSRTGSESVGTVSTVGINVAPARTASTGSELSATSSNNLHRVAAVAGDGSPLLFEQQADGTWTVRRLDATTGITDTFTNEIDVWTTGAGRTQAAVITTTTLMLFTEQADGSFTATDLGATTAGSTPIARAMTRFTTSDGRVYLAGYTSSERMVAFAQSSADSDQWIFEDISADLDGRGLATPVLDQVVSYVTAWNQWSIVGLDQNGDIQNIWVLRGLFEEWTLNNLSDITGAPTLASGLSVILTSWSGINLTALDADGNLLVTWWVPQFEGDWVSSNLSTIADNSGPVDDRVIVQVMTGYYTSWDGMNYAGVNSQGDLIIYWWVPAFGGQWLVSQITDGATSFAYDPNSNINSHVSPQGTLNVVGSNSSGDVLRSSWRPGDEGLWTTEQLSQIASLI